MLRNKKNKIITEPFSYLITKMNRKTSLNDFNLGITYFILLLLFKRAGCKQLAVGNSIRSVVTLNKDLIHQLKA